MIASRGEPSTGDDPGSGGVIKTRFVRIGAEALDTPHCPEFNRTSKPYVRWWWLQGTFRRKDR